MHALLLPALLASLTGLVFGLPYEFGYHPSAEEFDSLLRDTRTWTRDLLANERRRMWTSGAALQPALATASATETDTDTERRHQAAPFMALTNERFFVPKYNGEQTRQHHTGSPASSVANRRPQLWQSHVQKIDRPFDGGLEFQMFSDEHLGEQQQPIVYESMNNNDNNNNNKNKVEQRPLPSLALPPPVQVQSGLIEVNEPNKHLLGTPSPASLNVHHPNVNDNGVVEDNAPSGGNFPIFFTNPATGIVYAITEVGKTQTQDNQTSFSTQNQTIPIYITKAQYDNDIEALRQRYEANCHIVRHNSTLSTSLSQQRPLHRPNITTTTARPQIIRLQRPATAATISKLPTGKLPVIKPNIRHQRPKLPATPITMQTSATIPKDLVSKTTTQRPTTHTTTNSNAQDKPKKKRKKKKKRTGIKQKHPGLKSPSNTSTMPQIVLGTRRPAPTTTTTVRPSSIRSPTSRKSKMATQLERPHVPPAPAPTSVFHHVTRRSAPAVGDLIWQVNWPERAARKISSGRRRKQNQPKTNANSKTSRVNVPNSQNHTMLAPSALHLLHRRHNGSSDVGAAGTANVTMPSISMATTVATKTMKLPEHRNQTKQRKKSKRNKAKHRGSDNDPAFNLFDLVDIGATDDDDDDYDDDDDDDYDNDDDDDEFYESNDSKPDNAEANKKTNVKKKLEQDVYSDYPTVESLANLKEEIQEDNSSSPEESADFGAMEEEPPPTVIYGNGYKYEAVASNESNTKTSMGKKRIRRRPSAASDASAGTSDEDYNDDNDDEDDGIASSSIGGFFRMIFYPVQVAMSRFFDGLNGSGQQDDNDDEDDANKVKYPTYTLYNNAINQGASNEAGENNDDDEDSLGDWFSSLFGLRRKTKKIGSTTIAPLMTPPPPPPQITEEPSWLETWFGFGKATEQPDGEGNWFFSWFDPKPKAQRRTTTSTTTSTTTAMPQVPILTIVDPMRNPQNWIGILAHHIVNATTTSSTTHNPLINALMTRVTTAGTTTENPEVPRRISYEKYQIWRLKPQDEGQVRTLEEVKKSEDGIKMQWLKGPSLRGLTDVLVPPKILVDFQGTLNFEGIAHEVLIFDVGKAIAYEQSKADYLYTTPKTTKRLTKPANTTTNKPTAAMTWNKYYDYDDIIKYLETIRMRHTHLVELIHIGRSYEGRPLIVVKIEAKKSAAAAAATTVDSTRRKLKYKRKPVQANAVFIEAGAHGLAWIGPAAATWIINELLRLMRTNKTDAETDFIRNTTWYIMPVLNPDGYVYSHEYDRFWKKSRSRHLAKTTSGILNSAMTWLQQKKSGERICHGVDLDRNWQYHWGRRGSSKSPCNEFYAGPVPFSEPETKALSEFLMDYRSQVKLYISLQAYGQVISYPIKANSTFNMERMDDFLDVAMVGTDGLRKKGSKTRYKVDSANDLIEHRSGCSDAFAAYEIGIPFSYTLQLADNGVHGYLLPSSSIEPTARDAFEIITGMLDYI